MLKYTEDHEWLRAEGDEIVVGITRHASEQLGDVVFIELPEVGREVEAGEEALLQRVAKPAVGLGPAAAGAMPCTGWNPDSSQKLVDSRDRVLAEAIAEGRLAAFVAAFHAIRAAGDLEPV